ncbi:MAG: tyrosine-type recombinase/integrase, partial [Phycisphaerae bacterium]
MAAVFKKKYPIPMPDGAEIFERRGKTFARWTNGKGQERTAEVLDDGRVQFVSDYWYVRYTDADGKMRRQSTGCRDKQAAEKKLVDILVQLDKIRVGVISQEEMAAVAHSETPIAKHTKQYLEDLSVRTIRGRRISPKHVWNVGQALGRIVRECGFKTLKDIGRREVQRWMDKTVTTPRNPK